MAASSSGAEASSSVGWSSDEVAAAVEEVVSHTPLTNCKEAAWASSSGAPMGRQISMVA